MKHIFVMNPNSGKTKNRDRLIENVNRAADELGVDYEIYYAEKEGDGESYVKAICQRFLDEGHSLRVYACGGDGTINAVVNACAGHDHVEVGAIPIGTGNDYIRNYGKAEDFLDIKRQLQGRSVYSDLIKYRAVYNNDVTESYCVNMFNIGFDCNVVDMTAKAKRWPLVQGSFAYFLSVFIMLVRKKGADLKIEFEDGKVVDGKILLLAIANGAFCGGGIYSAPKSSLDDGFMDVSVINDVTRRMFIRLFPSYAKGKHLDDPKIMSKGIISYTKERALIVTANGESLRLCVDGEISTQKKVQFSMVKDAFKFIVPAGV